MVEGGKDVGSVAVILAGIGLAGTFLYSVTSELFGSGSPNSVYDKAFDRIKTDEQVRRWYSGQCIHVEKSTLLLTPYVCSPSLEFCQVVDYLGTGIKAHGSGRRQRNVEYVFWLP